GDVAQFVQHEVGYHQNAFQEARLADVGDAAVDDGAGVQQLDAAGGLLRRLGLLVAPGRAQALHQGQQVLPLLDGHGPAQVAEQQGRQEGQQGAHDGYAHQRAANKIGNDQAQNQADGAEEHVVHRRPAQPAFNPGGELAGPENQGGSQQVQERPGRQGRGD